MRKACFRLAPVGALVDAWIFARQIDQFFRDGAGAGAFLAELPRQVRGGVDLMRFDMLSPESVASMQGDLHVSATAADRLASTAEGISALVPDERRIVLDELSRQRNVVMDAVSVERERAVNAMIRAFAAERGELLRSVELQRLATLEWATAERRAAIADVRHGPLAPAIALEMLRLPSPLEFRRCRELNPRIVPRMPRAHRRRQSEVGDPLRAGVSS